MTERIKIAIVDDQSIFRKGVVTTLSSYEQFLIVGEAHDGQSMLDMLNLVRPDVVLLDMKLPDMDGIQVCRAIKAKYPQIHVIGLSVYDHYHYVSNLFKAGASSYMLKDVDAQMMVHTIEQVVKHGSYVQENSSIELIKSLIEMNHPSVYFGAEDAVPLKDVEISILRMIAAEKTTNEIADVLNLSAKTVENYRGNMLIKTGARNLAGLVTYGIRKGLIQI